MPQQIVKDIGRRGWDSLAVQWLELCASTAGGMGSIPGWEIKIPHAVQRGLIN